MSLKFSEDMLSSLRKNIGENMSEKRFVHVCAVEKMAEKLSLLFCPDKTDILRAAALLHDMTKEYTFDRQIEICRRFGIEPNANELASPKILHAKTASLLIPELYPEFADEEVISAVRYHTTGREDMTLGEKIIYLADYIDESRTFPDCVFLRDMFWTANPEQMSEEERLIHLDRVILESFDLTVKSLIEGRKTISRETVEARNQLIVEFRKRSVE